MRKKPKYELGLIVTENENLIYTEYFPRNFKELDSPIVVMFVGMFGRSYDPYAQDLVE